MLRFDILIRAGPFPSFTKEGLTYADREYLGFAASTAKRRSSCVDADCTIQGKSIAPVTIACCEDDSYQLEDSHHRLVAYWLSGQRVLQPHQYFLVQKDRWKPRFGQIEGLLDRVLHAIENR